MSQISIRDLSLDLRNRPILTKIDLEIASGDFCALLGPSGSGKTSLLRILLGEITPTTGAIDLDGVPMSHEPTHQRGIVFQNYSVFPHMTALRNILVALEFKHSRLLGRTFGVKRRQLLEQAKAALAQVGLGASADVYPSELSGGMRQRLAIAQALAGNPQVLLLDEPFGALDAATRTQLHEVILKLWRDSKTTIFMVTHDENEASKLASRVLRLSTVPGRGASISENQRLRD
jgi:NitT/TauT family transport system ATP-binding protein